MGYASHHEADEEKLTSNRFLGHAFRRPAPVVAETLTVSVFMTFLYGCKTRLARAVGRASFVAAALEELGVEIVNKTRATIRSFESAQGLDTPKLQMLAANRLEEEVGVLIKSFLDQIAELKEARGVSRASLEEARGLPLQLGKLPRPRMSESQAEHAGEILAELPTLSSDFCGMIVAFDRQAGETLSTASAAAETLKLLRTKIYVFKERIRSVRKLAGRTRERPAVRGDARPFVKRSKR
ncbi:MAG: hypothetical protein HY076_00855 [Candidatus Eisenbacteria bacterium]|uniref:Uncharacterized protein n=1 Tax=Eiseniibacteriota bacterium TaxID=2212470 RepID=A0A9D6L8D6_UNCEI|nr:hypothetical protein [Candidatus Eisenbacteria bacterium]MBI3538810.1 hypothetical protein [Candidatus Eisenbacteria bacterium]